MFDVMRANHRQARTIRRLLRENETLRESVRIVALENGRLREDVELVALCVEPKRRRTALAFVRDHHAVCDLPEREAG